MAGTEAGQQEIMGRYVLDRHLGDVANHLMLTGEVGEIGLLGIFVPLAGEDTPTAEILEPATQSPNSRKKVDKTEASELIRRDVAPLARHRLQQANRGEPGSGCAALPAIDRAAGKT